MRRLVLAAALLVFASAPEAQTADLLISEYVEGSGLNKAIEVYNGTGAAVDLGAGGYELEFYFNGSGTAGTTIALSGTVASGGVHVVAASGASAGLLASADQAVNASFFNGDDAVVLRGASGVVDVIGQVGVDPGSAWGSGSLSTQNNTLRRREGVCTPDADPSDDFDPGASYEGAGQDVFDGLGSFAGACGSTPPPPPPPPGGPIAFTSALPSQFVAAGAAVAFDYDVDVTGATFTLVEGPAGATLDAASGAFSWSGSAAPGVYPIRVRAASGSDTATVLAVLGVRGTLFPGESGATLRASLRGAFAPAQTLGYNTARDTMYAVIDRAPNGDVVGVYSGFTVNLIDGVSPRSYLINRGINAEHTWPQSQGAGSEPARSDIHNLFPSRVQVNSERGSKPFAEIPDAQTARWYRDATQQTAVPATEIDAWSEATSGAFEPREVHKGNAARASAYFYAVYESSASEPFLLQQRDAFVAWDAADPADVAELVRTYEISRRQGNVNPFVLDPTLVARALGAALPLSTTLTGGEGFRALAHPGGGSVDDLLGPVYTGGFTGSDAPGAPCTVFAYSEGSGSFAGGYTCVTDAADAIARGSAVFAYVYDDQAPAPIDTAFPKTLSASGVGASAPFSDFAITYTDVAGTPAYQKGWNLLGNPLAGGADWDLVQTSGGLTETVYVYDPNYLGGDYRSWTRGIAGSGDLADGVIPAFQGFFVKAVAAGAGLTLPQAAAVPDPGVYGKTGPPEASGEALPGARALRLALSARTPGGERPVSAAFVAVSPLAALGADALDAPRLAPGAWPRTVLSTEAAGEPLLLNALPSEASGEIEVPLVVAAEGHAAGPLQLVLRWSGALPAGWSAALVDREAGATVPLREGEAYGFALAVAEAEGKARPAALGFGRAPVAPEASGAKRATVGDSGSRFALRLTPPAVSTDGGAAPLAFEVGAPGPNPTRGALRVPLALPEAGAVSVRVYDALGRLVASEDLARGAGAGEVEVPVSGLAPGAYVVRLETAHGAAGRRFTVLR